VPRWQGGRAAASPARNLEEFMGLLDGKVAIVTGAGGGIGREHALALAREGASVVVNDLGGARDGTGRSSNMADAVVEEVRKLGAEATPNYDDVSTIEGGQNILKSALDAFERADILINNAGILRDKSFANTSEDMWDVVVKVHLKGTYCVTSAVYNYLKEASHGGVIINTSSTSGLNGNFGQCNYGAAKAGIAGFSRCLAIEGVKYGVNGNFGQCNYGAAKAGIAGFSRCLAIEGVKYGVRVFVLAPVAHTRLTEDLPGIGEMEQQLAPALVSPLITYLASDLSEGQTGKTFYVGGGRIAEMKVITHEGITKRDDGGLWTPQEIAAQMQAGQILFPE
jgi:NAD(P)-dependent dehydrogenase (short-subunit alcohol dehydrogenase family)